MQTVLAFLSTISIYIRMVLRADISAWFVRLGSWSVDDPVIAGQREFHSVSVSTELARYCWRSIIRLPSSGRSVSSPRKDVDNAEFPHETVKLQKTRKDKRTKDGRKVASKTQLDRCLDGTCTVLLLRPHWMGPVPYILSSMDTEPPLSWIEPCFSHTILRPYTERLP